MRRLDLRLYAVLDPDQATPGRDPVALAIRAVQGGATLVQLRHKSAATGATVELGRALKAALDPLNVPLIVNDRVDVALAIGAAGVHLGLDDIAPADARQILGDDALIGVTVHHPHEADAVDPSCADYAGIGPTFATASKDPKDPPVGVEGVGRLLHRLRARLPGFPACAIAGINAGNAGAVMASGVDGVAVIGALFRADDPAGAARELRRVVDANLRARRRREET